MDAKLRELARRADTDPDARAEWLAHRVRVGSLDKKMLELAGYCGDAAARRVLGEDCSCGIGEECSGPVGVPLVHLDAPCLTYLCRDENFSHWLLGLTYWESPLYWETPLPVGQPAVDAIMTGREVILLAVLAASEAAFATYDLLPLPEPEALALETFRTFIHRRSIFNDAAVRTHTALGRPAFDFHRVLADYRGDGWLEVIDAASRITDNDTKTRPKTRKAIAERLIAFALEERHG